MKLGWVIAYVADVPATLAFREAAFGLTRTMVTPDGFWGELDAGGAAIGFVQAELGEANSVPVTRPRPDVAPPGVTVTLITDDVPAAVARAAEAGAVIVKEPATKPWGQVSAYVRDPNGVLVELATEVG